MRLRHVTSAALAIALCAAGAASAQEGSEDEEARLLFQAGRVAFDAGRYDDALARFRRAHELSGRDIMLYNVGQAADRLGRHREALDAFEGYLANVADAPRREEVEARVAELRATRTPAEPPAPPSAIDPAPSSGRPLAAWALVAGGGVMAVLGTVLLRLGVSAASDIRGLEPGDDRFWAFDVDADAEKAERQSVIGQILLPAGVLLAGAGVAWWVLGGDDDVEVAVTPGRVAVRGRF